MEVTKCDLWLVIATMEETGLHHRTDTNKMAEICRNMLGNRVLSAFFNIDKTEVLARLHQYIYNHEF